MPGSEPQRSEPPQHPLVEALVPDPSQPPDPSVTIVGLRGRSATGDTLRLYVTATLDEYVEVPEAEVVHSRELPDDGGSQVWVRASATITHVRVETQQVQAEFLGGSIADGYVVGLATSVPRGQPIDNRTNIRGVRPTNFCASERICPTEEWCFGEPVIRPADTDTVARTYERCGDPGSWLCRVLTLCRTAPHVGLPPGWR
ncbi:MAG TPA: hypothetical protein VM942_01430 [Acidimicrobiales bacterium]|nr:hypothetical protein [Acidimicrobiales bacterium]